MRVLVVFDGSGDGFDGLQLIARLFAAGGERNDYTLAVIGWPVRVSPIWDRAFERQITVDDLHRAMAEVAAAELRRLEALFSPLGKTRSEYLEGEPVAEVVALVERCVPGLIIGGLTRGMRMRNVNAGFVGVLERTTVPALWAFGAEAVERSVV